MPDNRRQIYVSDADWKAVDALSKRWGMVRVQNGVNVPNYSATIQRAIQEALSNETV